MVSYHFEMHYLHHDLMWLLIYLDHDKLLLVLEPYHSKY